MHGVQTGFHTQQHGVMLRVAQCTCSVTVVTTIKDRTKSQLQQRSIKQYTPVWMFDEGNRQKEKTNSEWKMKLVNGVHNHESSANMARHPSARRSTAEIERVVRAESLSSTPA